jgi:antitoxin component of RelBE/YafQ-DinJ toxin-antitoxin module
LLYGPVRGVLFLFFFYFYIHRLNNINKDYLILNKVALKTFNVDEDVYARFRNYCKEHGVSMSKQVEIFMNSQIEDEPKARQEYLERLEDIRKGKFLKVKSFAERYNIK